MAGGKRAGADRTVTSASGSKKKRSAQNAAPLRMAVPRSGRAGSDAQSARPTVRRPKTTHKK